MLRGSFGERLRIGTGLNTAMLVAPLCEGPCDLATMARHSGQRSVDGIQTIPAIKGAA